MAHDRHIETLLDLDGIVIEQAGGFWTKFEVRKLVNPTEVRPHGIRYSLTLHDPQGKRVLGFDNAHGVKSGAKGKYRGRKVYDHCHRYGKDEGVPYEFIDAHQLLKDFWTEVDNVLTQLGSIGEG